jgi:hypothetical protein
LKKAGRARRPRDMSIRWELFLYLALFIVFVLAVVWLFQVKLLDKFYESIKRRELTRAADTIEEHIGDSSLHTIAYQNAVEYGVCVMVLRIEGMNAVELVTVDVSGNSVLSNITEKYVTELYNKAKEQGYLHGSGMPASAFKHGFNGSPQCMQYRSCTIMLSQSSSILPSV